MLTTMATALNARLITTRGHGNSNNTNNRTTRRFLRVSSSKGGGVLAKDDDASLVVVNGFWGKSTKGIVSSGGVLMSRSTQYYQKKKSRGMVSLKTNASSTSSSSSAKAAAASTGDGNGFSLKTGFSTLAAGPRTAVLFSLWYFFNIVFNVYNKSTLNVFPYPWLISTLQLAATSIWMLVVWATGIQEKPKVSKAFLVAVLPVAFFHMVGHVSACVSFSKMAVSFTHVIKAAEPVFSVILSGPLLGATYSPAVWASLIPIVLGCSMAAMKEAKEAQKLEDDLDRHEHALGLLKERVSGSEVHQLAEKVTKFEQELADAKKTTEDAKVKKVEAEKTAKALAQEIKNFEKERDSRLKEAEKALKQARNYILDGLDSRALNKRAREFIVVTLEESGEKPAAAAAGEVADFMM